MPLSTRRSPRGIRWLIRMSVNIVAGRMPEWNVGNSNRFLQVSDGGMCRCPVVNTEIPVFIEFCWFALFPGGANFSPSGTKGPEHLVLTIQIREGQVR